MTSIRRQFEILNNAIKDAWREIQNGGRPLARPAYARITRAVIAKRITEMQKRANVIGASYRNTEYDPNRKSEFIPHLRMRSCVGLRTHRCCCNKFNFVVTGHNTHELKHGQVGRSRPTRERVSPCSIAPNIGITIERQAREADESLYPSRDCHLRRRPKIGDGIVGREEGV